VCVDTPIREYLFSCLGEWTNNWHLFVKHPQPRYTVTERRRCWALFGLGWLFQGKRAHFWTWSICDCLGPLTWADWTNLSRDHLIECTHPQMTSDTIGNTRQRNLRTGNEWLQSTGSDRNEMWDIYRTRLAALQAIAGYCRTINFKNLKFALNLRTPLSHSENWKKIFTRFCCMYACCMFVACSNQQFELLISTIRIFDINNSNCCVHLLLISTIGIVDNFRYQQWTYIIDIHNYNFRYQ